MKWALLISLNCICIHLTKGFTAIDQLAKQVELFCMQCGYLITPLRTLNKTETVLVLRAQSPPKSPMNQFNIQFNRS